MQQASKDKKGGSTKRESSADPKLRGKPGTLSKKQSSSTLPALGGGGRQQSNENVIQNPSMETDRTKPLNVTQKNVQFKDVEQPGAKNGAKGKTVKEQPKKEVPVKEEVVA